LRKVRSIVSLIGQENLLKLTDASYQTVRGLHVYVAKNDEDKELALSIWDSPKEKQSSRCLFADRISKSAFTAALEYWRPRYSAPENLT
jgi:hypothetical protein